MALGSRRRSGRIKTISLGCRVAHPYGGGFFLSLNRTEGGPSLRSLQAWEAMLLVGPEATLLLPGGLGSMQGPPHFFPGLGPSNQLT